MKAQACKSHDRKTESIQRAMTAKEAEQKMLSLNQVKKVHTLEEKLPEKTRSIQLLGSMTMTCCNEMT